MRCYICNDGNIYLKKCSTEKCDKYYHFKCLKDYSEYNYFDKELCDFCHNANCNREYLEDEDSDIKIIETKEVPTCAFDVDKAIQDCDVFNCLRLFK